MAARDQRYLRDIREHATEAGRYLDGVTPADFAQDRRLQLQIERLLEIVGEASRCLSDDARALIEHDWRGAVGLRNVIAHQYGSLKPQRVYQAATRQLSALVAAIDDSGVLDHAGADS